MSFHSFINFISSRWGQRIVDNAIQQIHDYSKKANERGGLVHADPRYIADQINLVFSSLHRVNEDSLYVLQEDLEYIQSEVDKWKVHPFFKNRYIIPNELTEQLPEADDLVEQVRWKRGHAYNKSKQIVSKIESIKSQKVTFYIKFDQCLPLPVKGIVCEYWVGKVQYEKSKIGE
ncbi:MAG TPA: hypothetical protein VGJ00_09675 [Rhabdochlamydiaceae bacterium]|jgi:hypothetical protein